MGSFFFIGWEPLLRTLLVGTCAYLALVVLLRASGKRTLSKMNAFDFIVTVALGSTLASVLTSKEVALLQGIAAFALLILLQLVITWLSVRFQRVQDWVKSEPALLFRHGEFLEQAMCRERVTRVELLAAMRADGVADLSQVGAVVLETDGSFSVIQGAADGAPSTLQVVRGAGENTGNPGVDR